MTHRIIYESKGGTHILVYDDGDEARACKAVAEMKLNVFDRLNMGLRIGEHLHKRALEQVKQSVG